MPNGYYSGINLSIIKLAELLNQPKALEFKSNHPEVVWPKLKSPREYLEDEVDIYLSKGSNRREVYSRSGRSVSRPLDFYGLMPGRFIFKSGDPGEIEQQFLIEDFFYSSISQKYPLTPYPLSTPVCFRQEDGRGIYVMRAGGNLSLDKLFEGDYSLGEEEFKLSRDKKISLSLKNLAFFHSATSEFLTGKEKVSILGKSSINGRAFSFRIGNFNYSFNLLERAVCGKSCKKDIEEIMRSGPDSFKGKSYARFGLNPFFSDFLKRYYHFLCERMGDVSAPVFLHGDFYPTNVMDSGVIIDPKFPKIGNPVFDVSHFLSSPYFQLTDSEHEKFLGEYLSFLETNLSLNNSAKDQLARSYTPNLLHNSICLLGSMVAQEKEEHARYFLNLSLGIFDKLGENELKKSFVLYLRNTSNQKARRILKNANWN